MRTLRGSQRDPRLSRGVLLLEENIGRSGRVLVGRGSQRRIVVDFSHRRRDNGVTYHTVGYSEHAARTVIVAVELPLHERFNT